ncbi:MAG: acyl carrier protein [Planctomycetes bacterium]|nr:acyl carrier protein [Planctomycetota bacterium]MCH7993101.1 acyl carrier protein [Planctomycetota bacterium]
MSLKDTVEQQVGKIILDIIAIVAPDADISNVNPDVGLRDQLDMDSMDFLDIVMELRKRYKVEVPKEEYTRLATLSSCVEYLTPKLQAAAVL